MLTVSYDDEGATEYHATADGVATRRNEEFAPTIYVDGPDDAVADLRGRLHSDPKVTALRTEAWYTALDRDEREDVLAVDVERIDDVDPLAREIKGLHERDRWAPGTYRCYNVDFAREFRYCVATDTAPVPDRPLRTLALELPTHAVAADDVTALTLAEGDTRTGHDDDAVPVGDSPREVVRTVATRLTETDPDVLVVSSAGVFDVLRGAAADAGVDEFRLGRDEGFERLAGENTFESYGRVGHSPARYDVPGRAIVDIDSSFLWAESGLPGLLDLVRRSWRPLQETAWGSIGTILTSIQIQEALERDVLVPWNKWEPEAFKPVEQLHAADRGGVTFAPETGVHEDVVELDFASLYPTIMCEENISAETINCDCHEGEDVPGLGYTICEERGFVPDVLEGIVEARADYKEEMRTTDDPARRERLAAKSAGIKWILVSCFGYQGYRNAKFGRIECHEAINAFARELLLDAKAAFEARGWELVHGIVDSIWVKPRDGADPTPPGEVADAVSADVGIDLEYETAYDWIAFVPRRRQRRGALTKYFGAKAGSDEFKYRGIECRQRSTPKYVERVQADLIATFDEYRDPAAVCDVLAAAVAALEDGAVDPDELVVAKRASKAVDEYAQYTQTVAALERYRDCGISRGPGQDVRYVVVDDAKATRERVRLPHETIPRYDAAFYRTVLVRAAESVLSPVGWDRARIRRYLADDRPTTLAQF